MEQPLISTDDLDFGGQRSRSQQAIEMEKLVTSTPSSFLYLFHKRTFGVVCKGYFKDEMLFVVSVTPQTCQSSEETALIAAE